MSDRLAGTVALVTGAGRKRGIGRAIALRLAQEGADVAVAARARDPDTFPDHERAEGWRGVSSLADEIRALGRCATAIDCDITRNEDVAAMVAEIQANLGSIGALVNNAGVASSAGSAPIIEMDDDVWRDTLEINLTGVYRVTKHVGCAMVAAGQGGAIVNLSSIGGRTGLANYGAYCASKFAVIGLTQQLALELAPHNIRVNCICPGTVDTDMMDGTISRMASHDGIGFDRVKAGVSRANPMKRQGLPSEQAAVVAFLLSSDASFVTGQSLNVDGGYRFD